MTEWQNHGKRLEPVIPDQDLKTMRSQLYNSDPLPSELHRFFWEYDQQRIDIQKHCELIMARLMVRGDRQAMTWLRKVYSGEKIRDYLFRKGWKVLPLRELNYWALVGGVSDRQRRELLQKAKKIDPVWRNRLGHCSMTLCFNRFPDLIIALSCVIGCHSWKVLL